MVKRHSLDFTISTDDLERTPVQYKLEATPEQCAQVAERFELIALRHLSGDLEVADKGTEQGVAVRGKISADLTQKCITTLKPVEETVNTEFELLLVEPEMADRMDAEGVYLDADAPDYDALEGEEIMLGEILAQTLSISMNPYPRAEDAEVEGVKNPAVSLNEPELKRPNPFAVLAKMRDDT